MTQEIFNSLRSFARSTALQRASCAAMAWTLTSAEHATLRRTFLSMDRSNSGTLALADVRASLMGAFSVSERDVLTIFEALNMSGFDEIGYSEFLASMCASHIPLRQDHVKQVFACFDLRGSGYITRDGLQLLTAAFPTYSVMNECVASLTDDDAITEDDLAVLLSGDASRR